MRKRRIIATLIIGFGVTLATAISVTAASFERIAEEPQQIAAKRIVYLDATNWKNDNAQFSCYIWGSDGKTGMFANGAFMDLYDSGNDIYRCAVPEGYDCIIFVRQSDTAKAPSFSEGCWNQTVDMTLGSSVDCFTVQGKGTNGSGSGIYNGDGTKYGGTWSELASYTYTPPA